MSNFESFEQERSDARESDAALPRDSQTVPPRDALEAETHELNTTEDHEAAAQREPLHPRDWQGGTREILEGLANEHTDERGTDSADNHSEVSREDVASAQPPSRRKERCLVERRTTRPAFTLEQRLLILDAWRRSALPGSEFAPLVGIAPHTLYLWRRAFELEGPAGLVQSRRGAPSGSRLPEVTKRAILLIKQDHPEWGCQRISDMLLRGPALGASASAVARVLHEAGYEREDVPTQPHPPQGVQHEIDVASRPEAHAPTPPPCATPPAAAGETAAHAPSMPEPVCPHAAPGEDSQAAEQSDLMPPGTSPLDEQLKRLAQGLGRQAADPAAESPRDGDTDSRNSDGSQPGGGQ